MIEEDEYQLVLKHLKIHAANTEAIARACAMSQRRAELRRAKKRRWWQRRRS